MNIKTIQAVTIILFMLTVGLIWLIFDEYPRISIMKNKIKEGNILFQDSEDILKRIKELTVFSGENKDRIEKFDLILPSSEEKANLISNLDNLTKLNGLNILKVSFESSSSASNATKDLDVVKNDFKEIYVNVSMRGTYISFKNFLVAVEKNMRIFDAVSVNFKRELNSEGKIDGGKSYTFNIKLKTYFQPPVNEKNAYKVLNTGKFKNFSADQLGYTREKIFNELAADTAYNINSSAGEIGNEEIY